MTGSLVWLTVWLLAVLTIAIRSIAGRWPWQRKIHAAPTIKVIETQKSDYASLQTGPSDTMLLMWRLYPKDVSQSLTVMHPGFIHAQRFGNNYDRVAVFLLINGEPVVMEDDGRLFPSDALVTKIRLMKV